MTRPEARFNGVILRGGFGLALALAALIGAGNQALDLRATPVWNGSGIDWITADADASVCSAPSPSQHDAREG